MRYYVGYYVIAHMAGAVDDSTINIVEVIIIIIIIIIIITTEFTAIRISLRICWRTVKLIVEVMTQGIGVSIIRGTGRQTVGAVILFISYYVIALPVGISLMFATSLHMTGSHKKFVCFSGTNTEYNAEKTRTKANKNGKSKAISYSAFRA